MQEREKQCIIITGCDSGIGKALCEVLEKEGFPVIISFLENNPFEHHEHIFSRKMDLTKPGEIDDFVSFIKKTCQDNNFICRCLINNSGIAKGGPFENLPLSIYREVFEVNFFGLISLTAKLIGLLEKSRGKIIINGSIAGRVAPPFMSSYCASKFALEGLADSMRRELLPLGIQTILLEPGGIATPIWTKAKQQDISFVEEKYLKSLKLFETDFIDQAANAMDPMKAARKIYKIIIKKKNKDRYIIADNRFFTWLPVIFPAWLLDNIFKKMFSLDYGPSTVPGNRK